MKTTIALLAALLITSAPVRAWQCGQTCPSYTLSERLACETYQLSCPDASGRSGTVTLDATSAGDVGSQLFPLLADEIYAENVVRRSKTLDPLTPWQIKWLGPWLTRWGLNPKNIRIVYGAVLLDDYRWLGRWPLPIMDQYTGQTFGNIIYISQEFREKDGNLLILLSHEACHSGQYRKYGSTAGFGRHYIKGFVEANFSYRNNPLEIEARKAETDFRDWLCRQPTWTCREKE